MREVVIRDETSNPFTSQQMGRSELLKIHQYNVERAMRNEAGVCGNHDDQGIITMVEVVKDAHNIFSFYHAFSGSFYGAYLLLI